jgi:DNA mismatch repair ATPase MutS
LKKALANVQSLAKTIQHSLAGDLPIHDIRLVSATTANDEIEFPALSAASKLLLSLKDRLKCAQETVFRTVLDTMTQDPQTYTIFRQCAEYVAQLDVILCKAYVSNTYHYVRPTLCSGTDDKTPRGTDCEAADRQIFGSRSDEVASRLLRDDTGTKCRYRDQTPASLVRARGLRHVLIEHIQTQEIYVTNDIALGENDTMMGDGSEHCVNPSGILLYGTNAVGKTSLIRALGICVIMAQAGWYVPCTEFVLRPYRSIFSRILGNDNLFKGLSTFAVEMSELRLILNQADAHSLVLGDELCSGTETESALSIFMAGIQWLDRSRASFLFATHFHEIIHYEEMRQLSHVCLKHMSVIYDRALDCLIYDRKLRDGPGNRMYGLEVCKSLHLPTDFLEMAYTIRNKYHSMESGVGSGTLSHPTSHYNAKKVRSMCEMCNETLGEEIHHLQPQQLADSDGYIGHFHKNHVANLMSICSTCHDKIHSPDPSIASSLSIVSKKTAGGGMVRKKTTKGTYVFTSVSSDL